MYMYIIYIYILQKDIYVYILIYILQKDIYCIYIYIYIYIYKGHI